MIRRYGLPRRNDKKYTLRAGVYAILPRGGSVLLTYQEEPFAELQLPGGGIDPGESPLAALHREVVEETGWRIGKPRRLGAFRRFVFMPEYDLWAEKLCHVYLAFPVRRLMPPKEPGHTEVWMSGKDAARLVGNAGDSAFLAEYFTYKPF